MGGALGYRSPHCPGAQRENVAAAPAESRIVARLCEAWRTVVHYPHHFERSGARDVYSTVYVCFLGVLSGMAEVNHLSTLRVPPSRMSDVGPGSRER